MKKIILTLVLATAVFVQACVIPSWVNTVEADAKIAVPIAGSLIDVIDPALSPLVALIEQGFDALTKTLDTYKSKPNATNLQAVQSAFNAVSSNIADLETAAQVKNAATRTTVTEVVQLLGQIVTEIAAQVPASTSSQLKINIPPGVPQHAKGWTSKDIKSQYNNIIKGDYRFKKL